MTAECLWLQDGGLVTSLIFGAIVQRQRFRMAAESACRLGRFDWLVTIGSGP